MLKSDLILFYQNLKKLSDSTVNNEIKHPFYSDEICIFDVTQHITIRESPCGTQKC